MQVSAKARYALRLITDMAAYSSNGKVKIKDVSERQGISVKYLEQVVTALARAGYVKGERGPQGGYVLNIDPSKVTAGDIIRLIDGPSCPAPCMHSDGTVCPHSSNCPTEEIWRRIGDAADEIMDAYTVEDLAGKLRSVNPHPGITKMEYCI